MTRRLLCLPQGLHIAIFSSRRCPRWSLPDVRFTLLLGLSLVPFKPSRVKSILDLFSVVRYYPLSDPYSQSDTFNHLGYTRLFTAVFRNISDTAFVNSFLRSYFLLCLFELLTLFHARVPDGLGTTGCETFVLENCACDRARAGGILRLRLRSSSVE